MRSFWVSRELLKAATGWSDRTVRLKAQSGELQSRKSPARAANGRSHREYLAGCLSADQQLTLTKLLLAESSSPGESIERSLPLFKGQPASEGIPTQSEKLALSPEQRKEAEKRFAVIAPMLDFAKQGGRAFRIESGKTIRNLDDFAAYLAVQHKISARTIWRWYGNYKKRGFNALADDARVDRGKSRVFDRFPLAAEFVQAKYIREGLSIQLTFEALCREWPRLYSDSSEPPCYDTVRQYANSIPTPIRVLGREGERQFETLCQPILVRNFDLAPNDVWVSDHGKHDVWVRNDCFPWAPKNAAIRLWLTAILDMRSRKIVGAVWNTTPSSFTINSALRLALNSCGIPKRFYIDNGKDYEKVGRVDIHPEASGVLVRLGIEPQYCIPKHPQSKLIESWFSTVRKRFDATFRPFYCGASPSTRPDECAEELKKHERALKDGRPFDSSLPLASEFIREARSWIEQDYNAHYRAHTGRGMDGQTPNEVFDSLLPMEARRNPEPSELEHLLWEPVRRTVIEGGCILLNNVRYEPADAESHAAMYMEIGHEITVRYDPLNIGVAVAIDPDTQKPVAHLTAQELVAHGPTSREAIKASLRLRSRSKRFLTQYIRSVGSGFETERDFRRRNAGLLTTGELNEVASDDPKKIARQSASWLQHEDAAERLLKIAEEEDSAKSQCAIGTGTGTLQVNRLAVAERFARKG